MDKLKDVVWNCFAWILIVCLWMALGTAIYGCAYLVVHVLFDLPMNSVRPLGVLVLVFPAMLLKAIGIRKRIDSIKPYLKKFAELCLTVLMVILVFVRVVCVTIGPLLLLAWLFFGYIPLSVVLIGIMLLTFLLFSA